MTNDDEVPTPLTEAERAETARATGGEPDIAYAGVTPYDAYVHASTLHTLQQQRTDDPGEMSFLVTSQIMELYFGLLTHEWRAAQAALRADRLDEATAVLRRSVHHLQGLNAAWACLRWMTPMDFLTFRDLLGQASGFQSFAYREVEIMLGLRQRAMLSPHQGQPEIYASLLAAFEAPSLYDDVLTALSRAGWAASGAVENPDPGIERVPSPAVEAMWVRVYREAPVHGVEQALAEVLVDVAEEFTRWRHAHVLAVRRTMGDKPGSGGSAGLAWLERSLARPVFGELWSARTVL